MLQVSEVSETASDVWSTDVLASDTSERQAERLAELDQVLLLCHRFTCATRHQTNFCSMLGQQCRRWRTPGCFIQLSTCNVNKIIYIIHVEI